MRLNGMDCLRGWKLTGLLVVCGALSAYADTLSAGHAVRLSVTLDSDATQTDPVYFSNGSLGINKYGVGNWTLPLPFLLGGGRLPVTVAEGSVTIPSAGNAPTLAAPTSILNKAVFWVDASLDGSFTDGPLNYTSTVTEYVTNTVTELVTNIVTETVTDPETGDESEVVATNITEVVREVVTTNVTEVVETTQIRTWYDARETSHESPAYTRAVKGTGANNTPELQSYNGKAAVYFHKYGGDSQSATNRDGSYMVWIAPGGETNEVKGIRHAFMVHAISNSYGTILGSTVKPRFLNHYSQAFSDKLPYWGTNIYAAAAINTAKTFLDGEWIDTYNQPVQTGLHLLEVQADNETLASKLQAGEFFCDRAYCGAGGTKRNRSGGDYLNEVLVFTNALSETERMQVQAYLMSKWSIPYREPGIKPTLYGNTSLTIPGEILEASASEVEGEGTLVTTSAGWMDAYAANREERWHLKPASGTVVNRKVPITLDAGTTVTAVRDVNGDTLNTAAGVAGVLTKSGEADLYTDNIPTNVSSLSVTQGRLILTAPATNQVSVTGCDGIIPNPSFEEGMSNAGTYGNVKFKGKTLNNWTGTSTYTGTDNDEVFFYKAPGKLYPGGSTTAWDLYVWNVPDGNCFLVLKRTGGAYTTITLPVDGVYELSFYGSSRVSTAHQKRQLNLVLSDTDGSNPEVFGTVRTFTENWRRYVFRLPFRRAGDYRFAFEQFTTADRTAEIDDLKLTWVAPCEEPRFTEIPNGSFDKKFNFNTSIFSASTTIDGWTFDQCGASRPVVQLGCTQDVTSDDNTDMHYHMHGPVGNIYGCANLTFVSTNGFRGTATSDAFPLRAGAYTLTADMSTLSSSIKYGSWFAGTYTDSSIAAYAVVGETTNSLGKVSLKARKPTRVTFPYTISLTEDANVQIVLSNATTSATSIFVDDLRLENNANLVRDGGFEGSLNDGNWTQLTGSHASGAISFVEHSNYIDYYGHAWYEGNKRLRIRMDAAAVQNVTFHEAGLYQLRFAMQSRMGKGSVSVYGYNPVRAWIADNAGNTNDIGWTEFPRASASDTLRTACNTNFVEHAFAFRIEEPGTYAIGLQGVSGSSGYPQVNSTSKDSNAMLDGVSIRKVRALETPGLSKKLAVSVSDGARLRLDYAGTNRVNAVMLGDRSYTGVIDAHRAPAYIEGPGALVVLNAGSVISIR
ncbi:MAG: hypothetical protein IJR99_10640 [Kiritimatiellae bacterium]|nr:hypothetical protein [Kiritimatiellia bacterium]